MSSHNAPRHRSLKSTPGQEQAQQSSPHRPQRGELQRVNEHERQVQETFDELGNAGEKRGAQVTQDQLARGEVSRELREMRHGEIESAPPARGKPKRRNPRRS